MVDKVKNRTDQAQDQGRVYFDLLAEMDFTKHLGGIVATQELVDLCHIDAIRSQGTNQFLGVRNFC